jgi:hypothetical protein
MLARLSRSVTLSVTTVLTLGLAACGSSGQQEAAAAPAPAADAAGATTPRNLPWPVKTRQHLDTWLHGFAMLQDDTARVPFFRRGYREQMIVAKNRLNVGVTALDANRDQLRRGLAARPQLINAQFFPFQVNSWEEIRQFVDFFIRAEGNPQRAGHQEVAQLIAIVAQYFPTKADRDWLQLFMTSMEDERTRFYQSYWIAEQRNRAGALAAVDSLWQYTVRPRMQGFLNNSQLANGELLLSLPIGGEGRTQLGGKRTNAIATAYPATREAAAEAIYTFVHEAALPLASTAVNDNVTPAERREGVAERYASSAVVLGGLAILRKTAPDLVDGYARFYLREAGRTPPASNAAAALEGEFTLPANIREAMLRQIDIALGGI